MVRHEIKSFELPRPHLILENFLSVQQNKNLYSIVEHYEPQFARGKMIKDGATLVSFTKRLSRMSLYSPPNGIVFITSLVTKLLRNENILYIHPRVS